MMKHWRAKLAGAYAYYAVVACAALYCVATWR